MATTAPTRETMLGGVVTMRMRLAVLVTVSSCLLLMACSVIRVTQEYEDAHSKKRTRHLDGVPFYSMAARCKQETVWIEPTYQLTLVRTGKAKVGNEEKEFVLPVGSRLISWSTYTSDKYKLLVRLLEEHSSQQRDDQIVKAFQDLEPYVFQTDQLPLRKNRLLASNQEAPEAYVNYADVKYYNTRRPLLGTANAQFELSPNGTLAKGSAQIESKTLQAFLDLIPVKDVVSTAAKAALDTGLEGVQEVPVILEFTVEAQIYRHTLSTAKPISPTCGRTPGATLESTEGVNYSRIVADDQKRKSDDGKKVKFSGDVELPK